jgi:hypothetical protein
MRSPFAVALAGQRVQRDNKRYNDYYFITFGDGMQAFCEKSGKFGACVAACGFDTGLDDVGLFDTRRSDTMMAHRKKGE